MAEISKIQLPSGNVYDIKDATARELIAGGVSFNIVWTQTNYESATAPSASVLATIPSGVRIYFNNGANYSVGTLTASSSEAGKFYLIYSKTQTNDSDIYDEYVVVENNGVYSWEKIGDTQVDLSGTVTNVIYTPATTTVVGTNATLSATAPTITATASLNGSVVSQVSSGVAFLTASATSGAVAWNSKDSKTVVTGVSASTTNVKATATGGAASWSSKDTKTVLTGVTTNNTNIKATASGGGASWNSKDLKTVVSSVSATNSYLETASVNYLTGSTTSASKVSATTTQTTATGGYATSSSNSDWLKNVAVSSETLIIGAATMSTQSTTQNTFSNVTVPVMSATTMQVATGNLTNLVDGASVATGVSIGDSVQVIGSSATLTNTQPTVALSSGATAGTGVISVAYSASASGTASVIGSSATLSNTQPTIALSSGATAGTGVITLAYGAAATGTAAVIGSSATFTVTQPTVTLASATKSGDVSVVTDITPTYADLTASAPSISWSSKDSKTVLTNSTTVEVQYGGT